MNDQTQSVGRRAALLVSFTGSGKEYQQMAMEHAIMLYLKGKPQIESICKGYRFGMYHKAMGDKINRFYRSDFPTTWGV